MSNSEHLATLEMEEGRDKIKIIIERFSEIHPMFNRSPVKEFHLYLDEFMDAL